MINRTDFEIRYGDTDMMGVVYHANYLLYCEDGRAGLLNEAGVPYNEIEAAGYMCPIYHVELSYGMPMRYGKGAFVLTSMCEVHQTKITYHQEIFQEGMDPEHDAPCVTADVTCCIVERDTFKPASFKRAMPTQWPRYLEILEPRA